MLKVDAVRTVLNAFLGLFTQPFEQDLSASVTAAATSVSLAGLGGLTLLVNGGGRTASDIATPSVVIVLLWMAATAAVTDAEHRGLTIARNLSVVSFWIAATLVFVFAAELFIADPLARAIRLLCVSSVTLVLVPVHMVRNLPVRAALGLTLPLWFSTVALAWMVLY